MAQYIDKSALVAEIEKLVDKGKYQKEFARAYRDGNNDALYALKDIINTLEVKEVDFETAFAATIDHFDEKNDYGQWPESDLREFAEHFFELGLKAQQNISINVTDIDKVIEENSVDPNSKEAKMFKESYYMALEKHKAQKGE